MQASAQTCFPIVEGLHAERDAIDSGFNHAGKCRVGELTWSAFDGDFSVGSQCELFADSFEDFCEELRRQENWRSAAEVDGVDCAGQLDLHGISPRMRLRQICD